MINIGNVFGRLTVIAEAERYRRVRRWLCLCECGLKKVVVQSSLFDGYTRSCGCLSKEMTRQRSMIHGHNTSHGPSPEYNVWQNMIKRCYNRNIPKYKTYGDRGIKVHSSWHNFVKFLAYLKLTIGLRPSSKYSLDRIDNDGNYEPGNIRWATAQEQANNRRNNIVIDGVPLFKLAEKNGLSKVVITVRYHRGDRGRRLIRPIRSNAL